MEVAEKKVSHLEALKKKSHDVFREETENGCPRVVTLTKFKIFNIGKINANAHQFEIDFWFRLKWHDPSLIHNEEFQRSVEEYRALWFPGFEFSKYIQCKELWNDDVSFCLKEGGLILYSQRFRITCECLMDVSDFPFDINQLEVVFTSEMYKKDKVVWQLEGVIETDGWEQGEYSHLGCSVVINDDEKRTHPGAKILLKVQRKYQFYIFKYVSVIFFLNIVSITLLLVPKDELNDSFGNFLTLLLTHVAFSWILSDHVPVVSYLTLLDRYINFSYIALGLIHVVLCVSYLLTQNDQDDISEQVCYVSLGLFPSVHLIYPMYLFLPAIWKSEEENLEAEAVSLPTPATIRNLTSNLETGV